ncbi:MAG: hypothetical protein WBA51_07375 [Erythrobacter sp.]
MSVFVGFLLIALPSASFAQEQSLPNFDVSKQMYQSCVEYRSVRLDDGELPIDILINIAREKCRIERAILEVVISQMAKRDPKATESEVRVIEETVMERVNSENSEHISALIRDWREIDKTTND